MKRDRFRFRRTTLIAAALAAFLVGLGLARTKVIVSILFVWVTFVFFALSWRHKRLVALLGVILLGLTTGWWRGSIYLTQIKKYDQVMRKKVVIVGAADSDAIYGTQSQLTFDLAHLNLLMPKQVELVGKVSIKGFGENMVYKGDLVRVEGKLNPTLGSKQATMSFADIKVLQRSSSLIEKIRRKFQAGIQSALPEPAASFGLGLLIGQRSTLPQSVTLQLSAVGLTHVVAVSGYNLTIIMRAVRRMLKKRSKYQTALASIILIGVFLLFTGFSASIVRAAIVSLLSLTAWYYGRNFRPIVLILLTAAITAGIYPIYIWSDIGWYLSFLAFYGVMVLGPLITARIFRRKEPKVLASLIIETLSAQLLTMPIIMYIFGQFSLIALLANVLVVPLVPVGMLLCLIAGISGAVIAPWAGWLAWPAKAVLTYMLDIVSALAKLPKALIEQPINLAQMIVLYATILLLVSLLWHKNRGKSIIMKGDNAGLS